MAVLAVDLKLGLGEFELALADDLPLSGVLGVLGASGSGKSTFLRILSGLESRASGAVSFGSSRWQDSASGTFVPAHQRRVGVVFQDARLFPHLDVAGNLAFAQRRAEPGAGRGDIDQIYRALELEPLLARSTTTLSGGERQRVAIGRALLSNPQLLLLDEPLSALDDDRKSDLLPYLRRIVQTLSVPAIYVSHSLDELATIADQLLVLRDGRIAARGDTASVMSRLDLPEVSTRAEAGAVIEARVESWDEGFQLTRLLVEGQQIEVPGRLGEAEASVVLRVHARDVSLALKAPQDISIRNVLSGTVDAIQSDTSGPHAEVLVNIGASQLRARITRASLTALALAPGQPVYALIKTASVEP